MWHVGGRPIVLRQARGLYLLLLVLLDTVNKEAGDRRVRFIWAKNVVQHR